MKEWNAPELMSLDLRETGYHLSGIHKDGGYIGDGIISGHLQWGCGGGDNPSNGPAGGNNPANGLS